MVENLAEKSCAKLNMDLSILNNTFTLTKEQIDFYEKKIHKNKKFFFRKKQLIQ